MSDVRVVLRELAEDDWALLRELRLRALADSPDAFGPTLGEALGQPETYWRAWAGGRDGRVRAWAALRDSVPVGLVSGGVGANGVGHFGAVWADPGERGAGLGRRLVETVCAWLEACGCGRIELEVTEGNPAEGLYAGMGFARTGARKPLREGSPLHEVTMARETGAHPTRGSG